MERGHPARTEREARKAFLLSPDRGALFIGIASLKLYSSFGSVICVPLPKELG